MEQQTSRRIGPYLLVKQLGQGGMGSVWLAEQTEPVHRSVALKLIRSGMDSAEVIARFASERQALALMQHPVIAHVYDAGSTPDGTPYFVMEHIDGVSITDYCNQHQLTIRQRLELFVAVCAGVQHAHQKAILHRDLKPSNILVTERDGRPVAKIIDFGLAKAIGSTPSQMAGATQAGVIVGTPRYMSPEQMDFSAEGVDTRSDVYSLGVVLYELLTGTTPHSDSAAFDDLLSHIRQGDILPPSARFAKGSPQAAERHRQLSGDLDWITLKALATDREQRYNSASELAADIERHLRDESILARPPSTSYRVRKFVKRNKVPVALAAVAATLVICLAVTMTIQTIRISRERDRANQEAETTRRISEFLSRMFSVANPSEARGNSVTAREILDKAAGEIEKDLGQNPEVRGRLMHTMGDTYLALGLTAKSQQLLERAIAVHTAALGSEHRETLLAKTTLGSALWTQGHYTESEKILREVLEVQRRTIGSAHAETLRTMNLLAEATSVQGKYAETEQILRETLRAQKELLGPESGAALRTERSLGSTLYQQSKYTEGEQLVRATLETQKRVLGPEHPGTLYSMNSLALHLGGLERYAESESLYRETLEKQRRVLGPNHPNTFATMSNVAGAIQSQGRLDEAIAAFREVLELRKGHLGADHQDTVTVSFSLATALGEKKRYAEAEELFRRCLVARQKILGPNHRLTVKAVYHLSLTVSQQGRHQEAEPLFQDAIRRAERAEGEGSLADAYLYYAAGSAIAGNREQSLMLLEKAVSRGISSSVSELTNSGDLKPLRGDPRFEAVLARVRSDTDRAR